MSWGIGVQGGQGSIVTGVHRLKHVKRLTASTFTYDDSVGAHAQRVLDQIPYWHCTLTLQIGRPRLKRHQIGLNQF
jgi:hypothetical protein